MTTWSEGMSIFNGCTDLFHHSQLDRYVNHDIDSCRLPIQEDGVNFESQRLMPHEVVSMKSDQTILDRVVQSCKLMLGFYGMRRLSVQTGLVDRSPILWITCPDTRILPVCHRNMGRWYYYSPLTINVTAVAWHNKLRIMRTLKCLSELGLEQLDTGFPLHVLNENSHLIWSSMDSWWANCMRDKEDREWIALQINKVRRDGIVYLPGPCTRQS